MTYAVPTPPTKSRPASVRTAVYLLWTVAAINVVGIFLYFVPTPQLDRALDDFYREHPEMGGGTTTAVSLFFDIGLALIVAAAFAVLAAFVGKGSQPARITTWVLAGIVVLCQGCLVAGSLAAPALLNSAGAGGNPDAEVLTELARIVTENTPAWLTAVTTLLNVVGLLALLAVIILLALPASNDFFRKEEQVWVPPTAAGPGGFPQYPPPAGPQNPGQPPAPPAPPTQQ